MISASEKTHISELRRLIRRARSSGVSSFSPEELHALPRLYRLASSVHARLTTEHIVDAESDQLTQLLLAAHSELLRPAPRTRNAGLPGWARFFTTEVPRAIRAEWRLLLATFAVVYGLALLAYVLVVRDLSLAYSLFSPEMVDSEIAQLRAVQAGEPFRGNFTFGMGESASAAGAIIGNNLRVAVLFFAAALVPPLYLIILSGNSLMLGTYTGVAAHWDQAGSISSILWCHGVLEIQAIVIAGTAGLVLLRAWIAPGPYTRSFAMRREGQRALRLVAAVLPMLIIAGLIEGFVSPHAPFAVRIAVAVTSGAALLAWIVYGGRETAAVAPAFGAGASASGD